ncbi:hypothetical protein [Solirubrobacter soli]|uniref:hypothetical protein n=1 Tax=Solirubrobacter soli TaxID=363832 RepID=UPI00040E5E94|nr:hypothetical protein [Solirubrobacter soli]
MNQTTPDLILMELAQRNIDAIDAEIRSVTFELQAREKQLVALAARRAQIAKRYASIHASHLESS